MKLFRFSNSLVILLFTCYFASYSYGQIEKGSGLSELKQLLLLAQEYNTDIQIINLELERSRQELAIKKSAYLPQVNAFADYLLYLDNVPQYIFPNDEGAILSGGQSTGYYPVSLGLPNNMLAGINVSQRLFQWSYLSLGKGDELISAMEKDRLADKKEAVFYDVAACYFELLKLQGKASFIQFNLERLDKFIGIVEIQLKNQMTDSLQLLTLQLKKEELQLSDEEFNSGIKMQQNYLKMLIGLPDSMALPLAESLSPSALSYQQGTDVVQENAKLNLLNHSIDLNELSQKQVQSEYLPSLDLNVNMLWNVQSQNMHFFSDDAFNNQVSSVGLKLDIPIYQGAEKKKKLKQLELDQQVIELQKQKLKDGFHLQQFNAMEQLTQKNNRYFHQQQISSLKKKVFERTQLQFEKGILSVKELIDAQSDYIEAQMMEHTCLFELKLSELSYLKWNNQILTLID